MRSGRNLDYYFILSIIGAILLVILLLINDRAGTVTFNEKVIVGTAFILSCMLGISMAVRPNWIHRLGKDQSSTKQTLPKQLEQISREGHHPTCKNFESHTIKISNKQHCAGCTGLAAGAVIGIVLMCLYLIIPFQMNDNIPELFLTIGFIIIGLIFLKIMTMPKTASTHIISNAGLPLGFFFVVIGILELTGDIVSGLIAVIISFLWLDTRIQISNWRHTITCKVCKKSCKVYYE